MFENKEGQKVPEASFKARVGGKWEEWNTNELFSKKKVIVFSLPGAFTPTCSSSHVPRYQQLSGAFKKLGIDAIYCVSVNDAFVMDAWQEDQHADAIRFIPDGNGEFTEKMGMLVNKADLGFGKRSWRYSMLVNDGKIEKMFIEPEKDGDPFEVSDADTMLRYLDAKNEGVPSIALLTKPGCPYCTKAKALLTEKGLGYDEIILGKDVSAIALFAISGQRTTPQVFIDGKRIGGSDDLERYLKG